MKTHTQGGRLPLPNSEARKIVYAKLLSEQYHSLKIQAAIEERPVTLLLDDAIALYLSRQNFKR